MSMRHHLRFLLAAVRDYRVGAVTASSKYVIRRILAQFPANLRYVVEYGAGDGVITVEILKILPADGLLVAVEINPEFAATLRKVRDKRLRVVNGDAVHISRYLSTMGLPWIDVVVSGIPFSFLGPERRRELVENTYRAIAPGGVLVAYQHSFWILPLLKEKFSWVEASFEPRNFLPYFIFRAEK